MASSANSPIEDGVSIPLPLLSTIIRCLS